MCECSSDRRRPEKSTLGSCAQSKGSFMKTTTMLTWKEREREPWGTCSDRASFFVLVITVVIKCPQTYSLKTVILSCSWILWVRNSEYREIVHICSTVSAPPQLGALLARGRVTRMLAWSGKLAHRTSRQLSLGSPRRLASSEHVGLRRVGLLTWWPTVPSVSAQKTR